MGLINILKNPCTQVYQRFKSDIRSPNFSWNYFEGDEATPPYYSHTILARPGFDGMFMSTQQSEYLVHSNEVLKEIFDHNEIDVKAVLRINVNCTHYTGGTSSPIHRDHDFPHHNLLIYLSSFQQGCTSVYSGDVRGVHSPSEDDIIEFRGLHNMEPPAPGDRRIVLVATYI